MSPSKKIFFILILVVILVAAGYFVYSQYSHQGIGSKPANLENYLGGDYKGNYVWAGAMNLAWNELNDNILGEDLQLRTDDKTALAIVEKLNDPPMFKNDLDEASYYIKSGYGQQTVSQINKESRAKFPNKTFADLSITLGPKEIISYAYFLKEVEYLNIFQGVVEGWDEVLGSVIKVDYTHIFNNEEVKGFYAADRKQKDNVEVVKYWNDDKFIIKLRLRDKRDELFLVKGFEMGSPSQAVREINQYSKEELEVIGDDDNFKMPDLHLNFHRKYIELIEKFLVNAGFTNYFIGEMFEDIKFDMDYKGARVEAQGVIGLAWGLGGELPRIRNFILDKPFWVVMKRKDSANPYFILGVNNTELMEKI